MRRLFGQKPKPVLPDDPPHALLSSVDENASSPIRPQQPPVLHQFSPPFWNGIPAPQLSQQPTFSNLNGYTSQPYPDLSYRRPNPVDRAFVESQENIREGSIHSQQEKSWTRNFFGNSGGGKEKEANAELMRMIGTCPC